MKVAVLDDYQNAVKGLSCFAMLEGHQVKVLNSTIADPASLAPLLVDVDALVLIRERTLINEALLSRLPNLKLISQTGKISHHLDLEACTRHGVAVAEGIGSPVAPAELCWGLMMAASRYIPQYSANQQLGQWQQSGTLGLGRTLHGQVMGIWGYGKIGQRIARYAQVFGMDVQIWGSESSRIRAIQDGFKAADSKKVFFASSDIVSLHLRLNAATCGIVTEEDLLAMKPDSLLVNTSRAELIQPGALHNVLSAHPSRRAAVDVFEQEPALPSNEQLLALPNVLCTPHLGYVEQNSYELYFRKAFENVIAFANGHPENIANSEVLV
ncbi:D-2-hydroxyacid dehydrogenase family protein [Photobacterium ganghwense]|uniref:3-phosphoglycerate dehydrogenase n=1 Tax=Photobacterium ganghwense TaxID=320778 RepID=A0A0J1H8Y4_9GAMM|nr:D-2-hydroxyacid dehydrogenase family protein [Photobacterium ganghwense]KLV08154.1 3-phosphoglycerate dehydrogenase [Photobacterium ganghwense]PSU07279.1 D-2-hydroxyacid dehydrogenase family protein [Photobacterium ganghwense]QSV16009.1 D-2-hydroxyacid dehydrogenase family protein [Photobacterium ganghwense]